MLLASRRTYPTCCPTRQPSGGPASVSKKHPLKKGGGVEAMEGEFKHTLAECAAHINANYGVSGLCRSFPKRIDVLKMAGGKRWNHSNVRNKV